MSCSFRSIASLPQKPAQFPSDPDDYRRVREHQLSSAWLLFLHYAPGRRPALLIDCGPIGRLSVKAVHSDAFALFQYCGLERRRKHVLDKRILGCEASDRRKCCRINVRLSEIEIIANMEAYNPPPHDMVVEVSHREDALHPTFHRDRGHRNARRPHDDARRLLQAGCLELIYLRSVLKADLCIAVASRSVTRFATNSPVSLIFT
jgi:hypothetical protein